MVEQQKPTVEKPSLLDLVSPKSALIIGIIGGLLTIGTIGFIILGTLLLQKKISLNNVASASNKKLEANNANTQQPTAKTAGTQPAPASVTPADKPKVELFVMAYCPYGLQMEKAFLPVYDLLKNKADMSIKFVYYAMHGLKEVEENTRQYCIEKEQPQKYSAYLSCFYGSDGSETAYKTCLSKAGVNTAKLDSCYSATDKQFGITAKYNDQASWLSGQFPLYPINDKENQQYGVQGSPTLVINGVQAEVNRTPEAVKTAVCAAFKNAPSECKQTLSNSSFQPGFGLTEASGGTGSNPGCATN